MSHFDIHTELLVIGAGACGLTAALAARDAGLECLVLERDLTPSGSTSLSSGMVPAAGTRAQRAAGIDDSPAAMAQDIQTKARGQAPESLVQALCTTAGPAVDWLAEAHGVALQLVEGFLYPGHRVARMHAPASRTGAALEADLLTAALRAEATLVTGARVTELLAAADGRVVGVRVLRPGGDEERVGCAACLLACNGFGGNPQMVAKYIPEMARAQYFGHAGNQGDAVRWGTALGGEARYMGAYQGHGSVATPHQILITWALMMEGGIQVNDLGERFSNEHEGYSEQAVRVLAQPGGRVWNIYDRRLHELGLQFDDYRAAEQAGAILNAADLTRLARRLGLPRAALAASVEGTGSGGVDRFGRDFDATPELTPPYYAVRVTGALFHTQGGLSVDAGARVLRADGSALPNLLAGGGAACGVSGSQVWGYLSGNGLLSAVALGRLAAETAARLIRGHGHHAALGP